MARKFSRSFYDSPAWRKCRKAFISKRISIDGGMCEICHDVPGYIVDHIKEITPDNINDTGITLSWSNLQYLCLNCHNKKTFGNKDEQRYYFDEDGMVRELPPLNSSNMSGE
jgi:5-methylcytosine-specific restriction protein A